MKTKDRLKEFLAYKKMGRNKFESLVGIATGYMSSKSLSINSDVVEKTYKIFPDINLEWLFTGKGEMIKDIPDNSTTVFKNLVSAIQAKHNLSQKEIAEKIGLNDLDFSIMMSETLPFDQLTAKKFSEAFPNLNKQYLEMGKGEIFLEEEKVVSCSDKSSDVVTMSREVFELLKKQSETILSQQRTIEMMQAGQHSIKDCKKTAN